MDIPSRLHAFLRQSLLALQAKPDRISDHDLRVIGIFHLRAELTSATDIWLDIADVDCLTSAPMEQLSLIA